MQQQWELQLQDEAFLQHCLQQLRGTSCTKHSSDAADSPVAVHVDCR